MAGSSKSGAARVVNISDESQAAPDEQSSAAVATEARADEVRNEAAPGDAKSGTPVQAEQAAPKKKRRSFLLPVIVLALLGAGGWYGYQWWIDGRFLVSTDDAYIQGDIALIAPKVTGYVAKVNVIANHKVKAGDVLVTLDDGDYKIAVEQAIAALDTEQLSLNRIDAQIEGAKASLAQAQAQKVALQASVRGAEITATRARDLQAKDVGTVASLDSATISLDQANANLVGGDAAIASAQANITLLQAQRREAEGSIRSLELARDKANRDLAFTVLKAPYDGVIGNLSVQEGDLVAAGTRLAALVPVTQLYIDANFKETQIDKIKTGEKVRVHVDAFGGEPITGTVQSIAPASGSVFSMLPAENATGNFTKVVQRVPVRIVFTPEDLAKGQLRAGLSVVVEVDTRTAPGAAQQ